MSALRTVRRLILATALVLLAVLGVSPAQADAQPRIVNGQSTSAREFPYLVSLGYLPAVMSEGWSGAHMCGGTLIAPDLVLTAAHCGQDKETGLSHPGILVVGRPDASGLLTNITDERSIATLHVHPKWNPANATYDAALLRLRSPFADAGTLAPAVPSEAWTGSGTAQVVGWGVTELGNGAASSRLMVGSVHSVPADVCGSDRWHNVGGLSFQGYEGEFFAESMLCAIGVSQGEAVDTCSGDSGGPLVVGTGEAARLVGLTSWGRSCASSWPGVYTRVTALTDWIARIADGGSADPSSADAPRVKKVQRFRDAVRVQVSTSVPIEVLLLHRNGVYDCIVTPKRPACVMPVYGGKVGRLSVTLTTRPDADTTQSLAAWSGWVR